MLIRFNVENFLSFNERQEFSMIPGKTQKKKDHLIKIKDLELLKFCALYGANASGKSNFVKAIDFSKDVIIDGIDNLTSYNKYFRLNTENAKKDTAFEYEFSIDNACYAYGFKLNLVKKKIKSEWLYHITKKKEEMIYERDLENDTFETNFKLENDEKKRWDVYINDLRNMGSELLVTDFHRKNITQETSPNLYIIEKIYEWFNKYLRVVFPESILGNPLNLLNGNCEFNGTELLEAWDTGIVGCKKIKVDYKEMKKVIPENLFETILEDAEKFLRVRGEGVISLRGPDQIYHFEIGSDSPEIKISKIGFIHDNNNPEEYFEFWEESDGTRRIIDLLDIIKNSKNSEYVYVIDEIDRSLHPMLTKKLVESFFEFSKNSKQQVISTTHESMILDQELLRRDEVWFIDRGRNHQSNLFSLDEFKERFDKAIDKSYLKGRYGGIPVFSDAIIGCDSDD